MAWTQTDIDNLKKAISTGLLVSRMADGRSQTFRSLDEMKETLAMMEDEVSADAGTSRPRQFRFITDKGFR